MVRHSTDNEGLAAEVVGGAAHDMKKFITPSVGQYRLAVFGGENHMEVDLGKRLRHGSNPLMIKVNGPFRAVVAFCIANPGLRPGLTETALQAENTEATVAINYF